MFEFSSIEHYHARLTQGTTSCLEVINLYLARINHNKHLNAFVHVFAEEAINKAIALDANRIAGKPIGKLHGVVIGLKDVICYTDHPLTASSKILENFISVYSATAVEKLLAEDAIIIGTLGCDEFAMGSTNETSAYGPVLNPVDESKVPGGSSGGSAAAVSAGLCMLSLGSDTGGSVRQPADFCGIIGLKPTYGRISRYGLIAYASSFDQIGIFGKIIPDVALLLTIISGEDNYDSTVSSKPVPVYYPPENNRKFKFAVLDQALTHPNLDPEIRNRIEKSITDLKISGHEVSGISFDLLDYIVPAYYILTTAEASSNLSRYDGVRFGHRKPGNSVELTAFYNQTRSAGFGPEVKRRIMLGTFVLSAGYYDAYYTRAQKVRRLIKEKMDLIFSEFDFILLPTSPVTAFPAGEKMKDPIAMYLADIYTVLANLAGIPAISLPLYHHSNGMPFGLQVMANRFDEVSLLQVSATLLEPIKS